MKTFQELQEIEQMIGNLYAQHPTIKETKFGYAYKRFVDKNYVPTLKNFQDEIEGIRIDNALENETTKEILLDRTNPRGYKYSREGLKKTIEAERKSIEEWNKKQIGITPFISSYIPPELNGEQKEMLEGLVIKSHK